MNKKQIAMITGGVVAAAALFAAYVYFPSLNVTSVIKEDPYVKVEKEEYLNQKSEKPTAYLKDIASVFNDYNLVMPNGNRIRVCSAYGCKHKQVYRLEADLLRDAKSSFSTAFTAAGERSGIESALAKIEKVMGPATGTENDEMGGSFWGNGNTGQMNHQDEALNTTSILLVMMRYELIRYHDLLAPGYVNGTMYARIIDRSTGDIYAIDTGYRGSGGEVKIFNVKDENP